MLTDINRSQPLHAVFSSYVHGFASKWTFLCWTTPNISQLFKPLDHFINTTFLSVLTEQPQYNDLVSLPIRKGGLGIVEPSKAAVSQYANSLMVTTSFVSILTGRLYTVLDARDQMCKAKSDVHRSNHEQTRRHFDNNYQQLSDLLL